MSYTIDNLRVKNFKCFDDSKFYEFKIDASKNPIVLSGPNGFGKTTFFDAIEIMFSNNITRFNKDIENKSKKFVKNPLLNKSENDGFIVLTLKDENDKFISLLAKISKENKNIQFEKSVSYGYYEKNILDDELDLFLGNYKNWSVNLKNIINYNDANFNIFYYVSQDNSVHFLKNAIKERKNELGVLLNTETIEKKQEKIEELAGANNSLLSNNQFNREINILNDQIKKLVNEYKTIKSSINSIDNVDDVDLCLYHLNNELFYWDSSELKEKNYIKIESALREVDRMYYYLENLNDYRNYVQNKEINNINTNAVIDDYLKFNKYIKESIISIGLIEDYIKKLDTKIQIVNSSKLFISQKPSVSLLNDKDIEKLKELIPEFYNTDFTLLKSLSRDITNCEKAVSNNQSIIVNLNEARQKLKKVNREYSSVHGNGNICPYCNTKFDSIEELDKNFENVSNLLAEEGDDLVDRILASKEDFYAEVTKYACVIKKYINGTDDELNVLLKERKICKDFISDAERIQKVENLNKHLIKMDLGFDFNGSSIVTEVSKALSDSLLPIKNPEFSNLLNKYDFDDFSKYYGDYLCNLETLDREKLLQKKKYLSYLMLNLQIVKLDTLKGEIKKLIEKRLKIKKTKEKMISLLKKYENNVNEYKKAVSKKIRVPLLIYTAKILQDYQNGLGVFINDKDIRFVSGEDTEFDILNSFSSGQLSAFVLAFLFTMNKRFINKTTDDIGFILIDDPVQTMDDVNISSLIEVMRNEFSDKQIILSTHEQDKENYILYKFYKYGMIGNSFNVKKNLYE